jgi:hypothetical protein
VLRRTCVNGAGTGSNVPGSDLFVLELVRAFSSETAGRTRLISFKLPSVLQNVELYNSYRIFEPHGLVRVDFDCLQTSCRAHVPREVLDRPSMHAFAG